MVAFPSFTRTWHNKPYAAIDPTRPELSAAGKTVFITGGGAGVGLAFTKSFAAAGASVIAISGRTEKRLITTKDELQKTFPKTKILTFAADIMDEKAMIAAFKAAGKVDILVNNAAYMSDLKPLATAETEEWWKGIKVSVKGGFIVTKAFLQVAAPDAVVINVTTGAAHLPPFQDHSSYSASKVAGNKFFEAVQVEHPNLRVISLHPGVIKSDMSDKSYEHGVRLPFDEAELPGNFSVWLASPEAAFLKGKTVWTNWDVEELKQESGKISSGLSLTVGLIGGFETGFTSETNPA